MTGKVMIDGVEVSTITDVDYSYSEDASAETVAGGKVAPMKMIGQLKEIEWPGHGVAVRVSVNRWLTPDGRNLYYELGPFYPYPWVGLFERHRVEAASAEAAMAMLNKVTK